MIIFGCEMFFHTKETKVEFIHFVYASREGTTAIRFGFSFENLIQNNTLTHTREYNCRNN